MRRSLSTAARERRYAAGDARESEVVQERAACYLTLAARHPHLMHAFLEVFLLTSPERKQPLEDLFAKVRRSSSFHQVADSVLCAPPVNPLLRVGGAPVPGRLRSLP